MTNIRHRGLVVWFTGLSSAGKTTLAEAVRDHLRTRELPVELLDGDDVRQHLSCDLAFTVKDREENIRRITFVAGLLARHGIHVLVAAISPTRNMRQEVRTRLGHGLIEVYVNAPLAVCEERDVKGLYVRARRGEIPMFTGITAPYEPPISCEVECHTDQETIRESLDKVLAAFDLKLRRPAGI